MNFAFPLKNTFTLLQANVLANIWKWQIHDLKILVFCGEEFTDRVRKNSNHCAKSFRTHFHIITGHESKNKTKVRAMSSYWWPGMDSEIVIHVKSYDKCQLTRKDNRRNASFASLLP
jgi:hypothetical protein